MALTTGARQAGYTRPVVAPSGGFTGLGGASRSMSGAPVAANPFRSGGMGSGGSYYNAGAFGYQDDPWKRRQQEANGFQTQRGWDRPDPGGSGGGSSGASSNVTVGGIASELRDRAIPPDRAGYAAIGGALSDLAGGPESFASGRDAERAEAAAATADRYPAEGRGYAKYNPFDENGFQGYNPKQGLAYLARQTGYSGPVSMGNSGTGALQPGMPLPLNGTQPWGGQNGQQNDTRQILELLQGQGGF
jgi:hypothetical protein